MALTSECEVISEDSVWYDLRYRVWRQKFDVSLSFVWEGEESSDKERRRLST